MADVEYSAKEVAAHKTAGDAWMTIHGEVYDVTKYINDHPGGAEVLIEALGSDASEAFDNAGHSEDAAEIMAEYRIGNLKSNGRRPAQKVKVNSAPRTTTKAPATDNSGHTFRSKKSGIFTAGAALLSLGAITAGTLGYVYRGSIPALSSPAILRSSALTTSANGGIGFVHGILLSTGLFVAADVLILKHFMKLLQGDEHGFMRYPPHIKVPKSISPDILLQSGWLDPAHAMTLPLVKKTLLSPNVYRFTFELPTPTTVVGLPTGQHVAISATLPSGETVMRSYTPVSNNSDLGVLELVIKIYPDGKLTGQYLQHLEVGDEVSFRGPKGAMRFRTGAPASPKHKKHLGMVAGGTGITPMFQLIRAVCEDERDTTHISLIYANRSVEDILLRQELDTFARKYPQNLSVYYVVNTAPSKEDNGGKDWEGGVGFVSGAMMKERFAEPQSSEEGYSSRVMLCGPPGMVAAAKNALGDLGFEKPGAMAKMSDQIFVF